jgi:hypothetical protein
MSENVWQRFRQRLMEGNDQDQYLQDWAILRQVTLLPLEEARVLLKQKVATENMSDAAYEHFRKAMILVSAAYFHRAGLVGISDLGEWQKRYSAYLAGTDPEAKQYETFLSLRLEIDKVREAPQQAAPFSPDELRLGQACSELFSKLAVPLNTGPGLASQALIDELESLITQYESLLEEADPANRARRQALDAIAEAQYAAGRISLILRDYDQARRWFQESAESFGRLGDQFGLQLCRRQLSSIHILSTGDADAELRAALETLTREQVPVGSLDRAQAIVSQISQTVKAGDWFAVKRLIEEAVRELERQGYPNDEEQSPDEALKSWIESVPGDLRGNDFLYRLSQVVQLYAGIWGARASLSEAGADERLAGIRSLVHQLDLESLQADDDLQRRFASASARPLAATQAVAAGI